MVGVVVAAHWHCWRWSENARWVIVYCLCAAIPILWSQDIRLSLCGYPGLYIGGLITTLACAAGFLLAEQLETAYDVDIVRRVILCGGALTAIVCVAQSCRMDPFRMGPAPGTHRAMGFLGSPIDTGALFVVLLTYAPMRFLPYGVGLVTSLSRGAWAAAVVALAPKKLRFLAFGVISVVVVACALNGSSESDAGRRSIWRTALASASIKGAGPATFWLTFRNTYDKAKDPDGTRQNAQLNPIHAHNSALEAASSRGVFGIIGLLLLLWKLPELCGLWTICLLNPISFEVSFIACVLAGLYRNENWQEVI